MKTDTSHGFSRSRAAAIAALAVLGLATAGSSVGAQTPAASPPQVAAAQTDASKADAFLVVDCLLPSQVRRLGSRMTFLAPRRAIKTTGRDCEIRGGEYVSYDRANYATALKVWLDGANGGDAKSQTYVGEIYEKGLGLAPDYATAAQWYRKAADQNYAAAAINLGSLYERGLGVPKDPAEALRWYRRASGLPDLAFEIQPDPSDTRVAQLEAEVDQYRKDLEARQRELDQAQGETAALRRGLSQQNEEAQAARNDLEQLRRERAALEARDRTATAELERLRKAIDERSARVQAKEKEISALQSRLAKAQSEAPAAPKTPQAAQAQQNVQAAQDKLARAESNVRAQRAGLDQVRWERDPAGPDIELVNVQLMEAAESAAPKGAGDRTLLLVGRVASPAKITSFAINGTEQLVDTSPLDTKFRAEIAVKGTKDERVRLVAVDGNQRRCAAELMVPARVQLASTTGTPATTSIPSGTRASQGNYYALVIGISEYGRMGRLDTPVRDVEAVARVLRQDYGFTVKLLTNPGRTQILSELNDLREKLTAKDNLLIYFAGRGELNPQGQRGYWLPADAEPNNPATWISDVQLSDILNVMSVRQLLVVADSPYAATLSRSANGRLEPALKNADFARALDSLSSKRARMVLTSGGNEPIADTSAGGTTNSVFTGSFVEALRANKSVMLGRDVYREIQVRVYTAARRLGFNQTPSYAPIKFAGHDGGEFMFVRKGS